MRGYRVKTQVGGYSNNNIYLNLLETLTQTHRVQIRVCGMRNTYVAIILTKVSIPLFRSLLQGSNTHFRDTKE